MSDPALSLFGRAPGFDGGQGILRAARPRTIAMTSVSRAAPFNLGQLCKEVGLARSSVLNYEAIGLLVPQGRSQAGYRLYGEAQLERLRTIRRLREAGLSLEDIRVLLDRHGAPEPAALGLAPADADEIRRDSRR